MIHRFFLFYLVTQFSSPRLWAETNDLKEALIETTHALKDTGMIDYKAGCSQCESLLSQDSSNKAMANLPSKENHQNISLSVLSPKEVNDLFAKFLARTDIPFRHIQEGCYARAHKMARIMEEEGIISGKAYIEGHLVVDGGEFFGETSWGYHVASIVFVKKDNKLIPTILDPSLFNEPVPYDQWRAAIAKNTQTIITHEYFTNRFSYDFPDRLGELKKYNKEDLIDMELANKRNKELNQSLSLKRKKEKNEFINQAPTNGKRNLHTEQ